MNELATGNFWDVTVPTKPVGNFDPNSKLDIVFDWEPWLTDIGATIHASTVPTFAVDLPLEATTVTVAANQLSVKVRIQAKAGETIVLGAKCAVTCHMTASDGQIEDQTVYLKLKEK